jgi:hypothetical protein
MIGLSSALAPTAGQAGLQMSVGPAVLWLNGSVIISPFTFVFLSANSTSYVYLNTTSGLVNVNNSGYSSSNIPIATVVTNTSRVVTLVDTRPDFTNVGGGSSGGNFSNGETPSGSINSSNTSFTLVQIPSPALSLILVRNGIVQQQTVDYTISGATITMAVAPITGDYLQAWYQYA